MIYITIMSVGCFLFWRIPSDRSSNMNKNFILDTTFYDSKSVNSITVKSIRGCVSSWDLTPQNALKTNRRTSR
jgi:hypothetical protein